MSGNNRVSRPGWKRIKLTLWKWGAYSVRRQSLDGTMRFTHMARLNGVQLAGREGLADAQLYCERHAADRARVTA